MLRFQRSLDKDRKTFLLNCDFFLGVAGGVSEESVRRIRIFSRELFVPENVADVGHHEASGKTNIAEIIL